MENAVYFLYEILKSDYPIPAGRKEEALQTFAMGLDFGLSLGLELSPFQGAVDEGRIPTSLCSSE